MREWNDKYTDKGLVIIGSTTYYNYDWDDAAERIKRVADLSPEDERAAMVRFAKHHELKHRFMVRPKVVADRQHRQRRQDIDLGKNSRRFL